MYYPSSENKGADQLRGYREADLRLCFCLGKNPVFSRCGSFVTPTSTGSGCWIFFSLENPLAVCEKKNCPLKSAWVEE